MDRAISRISKMMIAIPDRYYSLGFWIMIGISVLQFLLFKYAPSLDGPQHLHNAYVLRDLLLNRTPVSEFYNINSIPVGYWTTPLILSLLTLIFPPWLAEKLLLIIYVAGFALAYRYLLRSLKADINPMAQFLVFPFIPSFFLLSGYYAFSFGVVILMFTFGYWNRISRNLSIRKSIWFSLLLVLFYFTHALVFTFFLGAFLIYYLVDLSIELALNTGQKAYWKKIGRQTVRTAGAFIPATIILLIYSQLVVSIQADIGTKAENTEELITQLFRIRSVIGFNHELESIATVPLFLLLVLVGSVILIQYVIKLQNGEVTILAILKKKPGIFLILSLLFLILYLINPDRFIAGSLTLRAGYLFFIFLIIWIPFNRIPQLVNLLMAVIIVLAVLYNQALMVYFYRPQVKMIKELQELDEYVEKGSTVYNLRESGNWLHLHFGLYAGLKNHLVSLNNPQCYGPFHIVWDKEKVPAMFAGDMQINIHGLGKLDPVHIENRQVDYLTVFYHKPFLDNDSNAAWREILENNFELVHVSDGGLAALYRNHAMAEQKQQK